MVTNLLQLSLSQWSSRSPSQSSYLLRRGPGLPIRRLHCISTSRHCSITSSTNSLFFISLNLRLGAKEKSDRTLPASSMHELCNLHRLFFRFSVFIFYKNGVLRSWEDGVYTLLAQFWFLFSFWLFFVGFYGRVVSQCDWVEWRLDGCIIESINWSLVKVRNWCQQWFGMGASNSRSWWHRATLRFRRESPKSGEVNSYYYSNVSLCNCIGETDTMKLNLPLPKYSSKSLF